MMNQAVVIPAPKDTDGPNAIRWIETNTRHLTVQSAYNLQRECNISMQGSRKKHMRLEWFLQNSNFHVDCGPSVSPY